MKLKIFHVLLIVSLFLAISGKKTYAQQTLVNVKLDSANIMIGEQTVLHLTITTDKGKNLIVPMPAEKIMDGVEVLNITPPDTTDIKNNRIEIHQDLLITSFDSLLYLLPKFIAIDGTDTLYSNEVALKVSTPEVNLEKPDEYYDIKDVWKPPFVLSDYYALIYGVLFTLFLICVIGYIIQRIRNKKPLEAEQEESKLPPHEQAILELEAIREQKLWQQGRNKEYYTEITDTLRRYITARYGESVLEKTSSEILDVIKEKIPGNKEVFNKLKQVLQLSDYVKFAKLRPLPDENDLSMTNANLFVDETKLVEIPEIETKEDGVEISDNNDTSTIDDASVKSETETDEEKMRRYAPKYNDNDKPTINN